MPGHARDPFPLLQVPSEAGQAQAELGLLKARVCARHRHVALAGTPLPAALPAAPGPAPAKPAPQLSLGLPRCEKRSTAKPDLELYCLLDLQSPGDFYPEVSWQLLTQCCL